MMNHAEVEDWHTYFVSTDGVLVHNACWEMPVEGGRKSASVVYNGSISSVYRGENDFTIKPNEIKINKATGNVKTTHGVSINVDPNNVSKFGGAYKIESIPEGLKIVQRGAKLEHFEIVPEYEMPLEEFQNLLNQIEISGPY